MRRTSIVVGAILCAVALLILGFGLGYQQGWRKTEADAARLRIGYLKFQLQDMQSPSGQQQKPEDLQRSLTFEENWLSDILAEPTDLIIPLPGEGAIYVSEYGFTFMSREYVYNYGWGLPLVIVFLMILVVALLVLRSSRKGNQETVREQETA